MNDKIGKLQLILPGGKMVTSDNIRLDPECPEEWHPVASFAEALRRIASDELVALTLRAESGDFDINVEQCLTVLEQCRCEGITPDENFVSQFYGGFVLELEKTVAAGKFRTKLPN